MASFVAYTPLPGSSFTAQQLCDELAARGLGCRIYPTSRDQQIVFQESADLLYLMLKDGWIDYVEHDPAYGSKPILAERIAEALTAIGFQSIDEDDPRWREG